ncbi:MAG TPA: class I SAM-dependent methyltransferase [Rhodanobacteraceae bacterium]|nr:class I SAM-dependent methyltransferase [Rhodanobacteraceae bacterium]
MNSAPQTNSEQAKMWNGVSGRAWVETQALLDEVLKPFEALLTAAVAVRRPARLLDVGCGTGATTIAAARQMGPGGRAVGIDISQPMIEAARAKAERANASAAFVHADAQTHAFDRAGFDMIVSRFGVMFFDDPVAAFANLRHASADDAVLSVLVYRSPAENPFMLTAERAAAPLLPDMPARDPAAPGQFAFADPRRVERIFGDSGWADVDLQPVDVACSFPARELVRWYTQLGPLGRVLADVDEARRTRVVEAVRAAFDPYVHGDDVRFESACWQIAARRNGA